MVQFNVLVADDELGMRLGAEKSLRKYSFHPANFNEEISFIIFQAENGTQALELLKTGDIHILLLDYKLPDVNGLEILSRAESICPGVISIMITAYASLEVAISATKKGGFDFLAKPFTPDELRIIVRKAAEKIFLNNKARELEKEKKKVRFQFISVLAHELKSPLNAVENYLHLLHAHTLGDELPSYDHMIDRSLLRMQGMRRLITDLLDLTRIESGEKKREMKELSMAEILQPLVEEQRLEAEKRGITIKTEIDESLLFTADQTELEIIMSNMVSNAIKYNKQDGHVDIIITGDRHQIQIICKDTGIGISEDDQKRLFREFTRIKNDQTRDILGTGLGLAVIKKIVELYNGVIELESRVGEGTSITITLPIQNTPIKKENPS